MISAKSTFSVQNVFFHDCWSILVAREGFWSPPGSLLSALVRSWGATGRSRGSPGSLLDPLWQLSWRFLDAPGAHLRPCRGAKASRNLILSVSGLDFHCFTSVFLRAAPRMIRTYFSAAVCAQHLESATGPQAPRGVSNDGHTTITQPLH